MNFKEFCNGIHDNACIISVQKVGDTYGEIRIVDGNDAYLNTFKGDFYVKHDFVPNSIYTDYLERNLNFEEYCYRAAVKKELLHSYAYPEYFKAWLHMLFIPVEYETEDLSYCIYIMDINPIFNPELLANPSGDIYSKVLNTTLQLANTADFELSLKNVTGEIRNICNASFCCIMLVNKEKKELVVLSQDRDLESDRLDMNDYLDEQFYDLAESWDETIGNSNCIIIKDDKGMDYIKEQNPKWHSSLVKAKIDSLVLFRLKSENNQLGYMWVSNFKADDTPKIKEALEITTFVLGSSIASHLMLEQLKTLSSTDMLTGLYNRHKLNEYMKETLRRDGQSTCLLFMDINGLKKINDSEGHDSGDDLIKRAAKVLKDVFSNQLLFRVGGDEFVAILRGVNEEEIKEYVEELKQKENEANVSFAIGYSFAKNSKDIEKMLQEADYKMYQDKREHYKK